MDYEKKYKEALERAKEIIECSKSENTKEVRMVLSFFPELKGNKDEQMRKKCIELIKELKTFCMRDGQDECITWLEKRGEQKPAEWSEEDEEMLQYAIEHFERQKRNSIEDGGRRKVMQEFIDWLKSLRPNHWKPSDAQMEVLVWCKPLFTDPKSKGILESLINDLKNL